MRFVIPKLFLLCLVSSLFSEVPSLQIELRHLEPKGVGFDYGYSTIEAFWIPGPDCKFSPYVDLRGHVFNDGKKAFNGGIGGRALVGSRVWGFNTYYDYREIRSNSFNQVSFGFEAIGESFDVYGNGYVVVGRKTTALYGTEFYGFENFNVLIQQKFKSVLSGADGTFRYHFLKQQDWDFYIDATPYYYHDPEGSALFGGKTTVGLNLYDHLYLKGSGSYDHTFKWIGEGVVGINFTFGPKVKKDRGDKTCSTSSLIGERFIQFPDHNEIIVAKKHKAISVAMNPATGQPYSFLFVNNTHPFSDGSYGDPYGTLLQAQMASVPRTVFYIWQGDGTTTGMDQGITLQDDQQLLGSGIAQTLQTTLGPITIPQMTRGFPVITYKGVTSGAAVTLANNNVISGIHIDSATYYGISGAGVTNSTIINNLITDINTTAATQLAAISILNGVNGTFTISNNTLISKTSTQMVGIELIPQPTDQCVVNLSGNSISVSLDGVSFSPYGISTLNSSSNSYGSTTVQRAFYLQPHGTGNTTYSFQNDYFTSDGDVGLLVGPADSSSCTGLIQNCIFEGNDRGLDFRAGGGAILETGYIFGNTFRNNTTSDFRADMASNRNGTICVSLLNNYAPDNGYIFTNNQAAAEVNLTVFTDNIGGISTNGTYPYTTNPTCP